MSSLSQRFETFIKSLDGFESIDALLRGADPKGRKRADYLLQNRHVVIEQKVLQSNPIGRPQKFVDKLAQERGIRIYGEVSTDVVFAGQPDSAELKRRMVLDLARVIDDDVANADRQTEDTRQLLNIPNALGILVLLNESADLLRHDVVHYALWNSFQKKSQSGALRYAANDAVILISEATPLALSQSQRAFPILSFTSTHRHKAPVIAQFSDMLMNQWAASNHIPLVTRQAGGGITPA